MRLAQESAQAAFGDGAYEEAALGFSNAMQRAFIRDDGRAVARFRYQLAACRIAQGRMAEGKSLLNAAREEALVAGDGLVAARAETAAARLALEQGDLTESQRMARLALGRPEAKASVRLSADIHLVLAEGAVRGGDPLKATAELTEANRMWGRTPVDPVFQAVSERIRGQVLLLAGDAQGAGAAFDKESVHWQQCRRFAENADSLERAALTWHTAGDSPGAAARIYRAARVRLGLGHLDKAHLLAGLAAEWAETAALPDLKSRALALAKETEKPATP
jgi:tetratricopeptide (TPR) repeat protein